MLSRVGKYRYHVCVWSRPLYSMTRESFDNGLPMTPLPSDLHSTNFARFRTPFDIEVSPYGLMTEMMFITPQLNVWIRPI